MRMTDKGKACDGAGSAWLGRDAVQGKTWMEIFRCGDPAPDDGRDCSIMLSTREERTTEYEHAIYESRVVLVLSIRFTPPFRLICSYLSLHPCMRYRE